MTREIALHCMKSASELERELCEECPIYGQTGCDHCYEDALQYVIGMLEQEPLKPTVEIDLYSVIKQKYIEREVLDKIRAEMKPYTDPQGFICISEKRLDDIFKKCIAESEALRGEEHE